MKFPKIASTVIISYFLLLSCEKKGSEPSGPELPSNPFKLLPDSGRIGSLVKIYGRGFYPSGNLMRFTGTFNFWSYPATGDTISAEVPFGAQNGPITILMNSGDNQTLSFMVTESYDPAALALKWWDLPPPSQWLDSCNFDVTGIWRCWERNLSGDTLILTLSDFRISQTDVRTEVFKFKQSAPGNLPSVVAIIVYTNYAATSRIDTLKRGLIKFRRWDSQGRIEGQIFPAHWDIPPYFVTFFMNG